MDVSIMNYEDAGGGTGAKVSDKIVAYV